MLTETEYRDLAKQFQAEMRVRFPRLRVYVSGANGENQGVDAFTEAGVLDVRSVLVIEGRRVWAATHVNVTSARLALDEKDACQFIDIAITLARQIGNWLIGI